LTDFLEGGAKYEKTKFACKNTKKSQFGGGGANASLPPPPMTSLYNDEWVKKAGLSKNLTGDFEYI